ncbi:MAG: hypothetical protein ACRCU5_12305 [Rhizobiaceae bacterium]
MKHLLLSIVFSLLSFSCSAQENDARKETCDVAKLLIENGGKAGAQRITELMSWLTGIETQLKSATKIFEDRKFSEGESYIVADFGGLSEQHLLVLSSESDGNFYFHFYYQKRDGKMILANINFADTYFGVTDKSGPFPMEPIKIECL